jgi:hypothetical protein
MGTVWNHEHRVESFATKSGKLTGMSVSVFARTPGTAQMMMTAEPSTQAATAVTLSLAQVAYFPDSSLNDIHPQFHTRFAKSV